MKTCETCDEPVVEGDHHCGNCVARQPLSADRLRGEIVEAERREIVREATQTDRMLLSVRSGVRYQPNARNVLMLRIECRHRDVLKVIVRPEIPGVALDVESASMRLMPRIPTQIAIPFFAKEPGERVLHGLEIEVRREGGTEFYELMDQSVTLPVGDPDGPVLNIGAVNVAGPNISDQSVEVGDRTQVVNIQANAPSRETTWREVALLRDMTPRFGRGRELAILRPPSDRERPFRIGQLVVDGDATRRVFLAAGRVIRFGRTKNDRVDSADANHFVVRVLPSVSKTEHAENWAHSRVISSRHGRFEVIGNKVMYVDTSSAGTLFDGKSLLRSGDRIPLGDEPFKLQLGSGRAVLHGRLLRRFGMQAESLAPQRGYFAPTLAKEGPPGFGSGFPFDGLWLSRDRSAGATGHVYGAIFRELRLSPDFEPLFDRTAAALRLLVGKGDIFIGGEGVDVDIELRTDAKHQSLRITPGHVVPLRDGMTVRVGDRTAVFRNVSNSDFTPGPDVLGSD